MKQSLFFTLFVFVFGSFYALAQAGNPVILNFDTPPLLAPYTAQAPEIASQAAVLFDAATGTVLYSKNSDDEIPPASLTKLMTMHLVMNEVDAGRASLDEIIPIDRRSWAQSQPPRSSLMFLAPGQIVTLREIMLGLAVSSGNDAAVAAALRLAPSVRDFAALMNAEARRLGLTRTRFIEPSGVSEQNITTAADFASFCGQYIRLHPRATADFHSVPEFAYPKTSNMSIAFRDTPNTIVQQNRNSLLKTFPGVDGLKTGYIDEAGYNIALTAERNSTRFILIILGAPARPGGDRIRDADGARLLSWAFDNFKTVRPAPVQIEKTRLWKGKANYVELSLAKNPVFTAPTGRARSLSASVVINEPLVAPLPAAYPAGSLVISDDQGGLYRITLQTTGAYERGNIFKRLWHSFRLLFRVFNSPAA